MVVKEEVMVVKIKKALNEFRAFFQQSGIDGARTRDLQRDRLAF